jgi:hypothetical protein
MNGQRTRNIGSDGVGDRLSQDTGRSVSHKVGCQLCDVDCMGSRSVGVKGDCISNLFNQLVYGMQDSSETERTVGFATVFVVYVVDSHFSFHRKEHALER